MKKKNNLKKILIKNLPAAITLILMSVALAVTVKFNFFLSLIVLVILYFVFGVIIEIILDKTKKKDDLYTRYKNGQTADADPDEFDIPERTAESEMKGVSDDLAAGADAVFAESDDIETAVMVGAVEDYSETEEKADEQTDEETLEEAGEGDAEIVVRAIDKTEESESSSAESEEEETDKEFERQEAEETAEGETQSQSSEEKTVEGKESSEEGFEQLSLDSLMNGTLGYEKADRDDAAIKDISTEEKIPEEIRIIDAPEITANIPQGIEKTETEEKEEPIGIIEPTLEKDIEIVLTPAAGIDNEVKEKAIEDANEVIAPVIQAREEEESSLKTALENIGTETTEDTVATAEAEARKSLFEDDEFEEANLPKAAPSIIFGSVPDTDDEIDEIPSFTPAATPSVPQRGKVKVDSKKIDDLYSFNKANKGERFFGKSRKS